MDNDCACGLAIVRRRRLAADHGAVRPGRFGAAGGGTEAVMDINPIEVQKHLKGVSYPASREELVEVAERNDAPEEIVDELRSLDAEQFDGPDDVQDALS
jgi:uncharacterized protein DUF2795